SICADAVRTPTKTSTTVRPNKNAFRSSVLPSCFMSGPSLGSGSRRGALSEYTNNHVLQCATSRCDGRHNLYLLRHLPKTPAFCRSTVELPTVITSNIATIKPIADKKYDYVNSRHPPNSPFPHWFPSANGSPPAAVARAAAHQVLLGQSPLLSGQ